MKPAIDMLHVFSPNATIIFGASGPPVGHLLAAPSPNQQVSVAIRSVPLVVRQMITQQATLEAIRRADVVRVGKRVGMNIDRLD